MFHSIKLLPPGSDAEPVGSGGQSHSVGKGELGTRAVSSLLGGAESHLMGVSSLKCVLRERGNGSLPSERLSKAGDKKR